MMTARRTMVPPALSSKTAAIGLIVLVGCRGQFTEETSNTTSPSTSTDPCALAVSGTNKSLSAPILSADVLLSDASPASPVNESAFTMPTNAPLSHHRFEGRFALHDEAQSSINVHMVDDWITPGKSGSTLPQIDLEFVQCGRDLIPTKRGRIITDDPYWDIVVMPGHAWSTDDDSGMSRAAVPFSLAFKTENCLQNGVMTFLYDDTSMSQVRYQVTQETCPWFSFDMWGQSSATYTPAVVNGADALRTDFLRELENRYPIKPFEALETDFTGVSVDVFNDGLTLNDQTSRGVLVNDTLYLDDCPTRFGTYAFCETIALPSYSLAKTLHLGLTMTAMAQELSIDPYAQLVTDLLPAETASSVGQWDGITVEHLIDMSTGHYRYTTQSDDYLDGFFANLSLEERLRSSFEFPYKEPAGERTVYLTPHSQIAAAAMDAILVSQKSTITDSFEYAVERIYKPAGMSPDSHTTLRTWEDGGQNNGTAFGGYGMVLTPQNIARLGRFILDDGYRDGTQWLHPTRLAETLFQDPTDTGAPMYFYGWLYNNAMWGYPLSNWGLGCDDVMPVLFGVSGNTVMLAPNGVVYFTFNDRVEYTATTGVVEQLDIIAPLCAR